MKNGTLYIKINTKLLIRRVLCNEDNCYKIFHWWKKYYFLEILVVLENLQLSPSSYFQSPIFLILFVHRPRLFAWHSHTRTFSAYLVLYFWLISIETMFGPSFCSKVTSFFSYILHIFICIHSSLFSVLLNLCILDILR